MAAPQQQPPAPQQGPISNDDVAEWTARFNDVLARPGEYVNSKSPESAQPWYNSFFGCFAPIETCLMSWCCPCVVFGRTHHRLRKSANLAGYEPINTSCLLFCASGCVALHWIPMAMQRADLRTKHNLQGSCLVDIATSCCCGCCHLAQNDKEAEYREQLLASQGIQQGYQAAGGMAYPGGHKQ
ncbi:PLAC8 family-domain-containing protein [Chaetomium strumarium]|uniref:PLAC8 family-domain-containing protein n=1 Tax=Chaetomium strumarium TaxID=1170767 RepID=A0AAJ0GND2_9PEZI|nr:PLAC8 family-domain-containing protein [Chaetomium strumarium]